MRFGIRTLDELDVKGKTVLCRGAGKALGLDHLSSPTFTIVQEYPTAPPLFHFDAYRLADEDELYAMGFEDYLDRGGVCAVEWSENVWGAMEDAVVVTISRLSEDTRRIEIEGGDRIADLSL